MRFKFSCKYPVLPFRVPFFGAKNLVTVKLCSDDQISRQTSLARNHTRSNFSLRYSVSILFLFLFITQSTPTQADEYLWAGANQYQLWFQRRGRIQMQLNAMQDAGLKVLRIFLGERSYQSWEDPPDAYTFENPVGTYNDTNLALVDELMSECAKRDIKLIIALNNHNDLYYKTWGAIGMYSNPEANQAYKNRFRYFLNHHNALLNKAWKECDDVVYAWEIQNEPGIPLIDVSTLTSQQRHDMMRSYLNEMADYLKSIDPNTKVALGIAGYANYYHSGKSGDDIRTLGNIESADIYTLHFYGGNLSSWINDNLSYCRSINKLLFVEEFGNTRNQGMETIKANYHSVAQTCRTKGVPWMFWRLGHRKDDGTWSIMSDDAVWTDVVKPEAALINQTTTSDAWGINPLNTSVTEFQEPKRPDAWMHVYPNPARQGVTINFRSSQQTAMVHIYNMQGQEVFRMNCRGTSQFRWYGLNMSGTAVPNGVYFVQVQTGTDYLNKKICVIR